jgi:hypothetical protein
MEYLQYQLHVSASTLAIIRLAFNLSRDYTICMECSGKGERGGNETSFYNTGWHENHNFGRSRKEWVLSQLYS